MMINSPELRFRDELAELIVRRQKTATWRLSDEKGLAVGQNLGMIHGSTGRLFARGVIEEISERTFGTLREVDRAGHETYASDEQMLQTFSEYYSQAVTLNTPVKVVHFRLWLHTTQPGSDETNVVVLR